MSNELDGYLNQQSFRGEVLCKTRLNGIKIKQISGKKKMIVCRWCENQKYVYIRVIFILCIRISFKISDYYANKNNNYY